MPDTSIGNDVWETIKRGDVDGVSFGMRVTKDKWSSEKRESGGRLYKRSILNAELYEISPVAFPAYPANEVSVRSLDDYRNEQRRAATEYQKRKLLLWSSMQPSRLLFLFTSNPYGGFFNVQRITRYASATGANETRSPVLHRGGQN
ncbi:HK97 family phage prohead protease [Paenibacillus silviterrae]|uniref:HK97 family phage prohead protease n=1 Tax=Paenibacillus silviterrae TaxID=3242194 RepID=UPI003558EA6B